MAGRAGVLPVSGIATRETHNGGGQAAIPGSASRRGGKAGAALFPGSGVEADRRGSSEVEALSAAVDGDTDRLVGERKGFLRQSPCLIAEDPRHRTGEHACISGLIESAFPLTVRGKQGEPGVPEETGDLFDP